MNASWRYLLALVAGFLLSVAVFVALLYTQLGVPGTNSSLWISVILQKKQRLAAAMPGPRLFALAGSSTLFGINAKTLEQETGCPTMNLGGHAGLGLGYILYFGEKNARPGDTIFLPLEYEFYDPPHYDESYDDFVLGRDPDYIHQLSWPELITMATRVKFVRLQVGWRNRFHPKQGRPPPNYEESIDDHGDGVNNQPATRDPNNPGFSEKVTTLLNGLPSDHTASFDKIRSFIAWARAHHVQVLAGFPNTLHRTDYDGPNAKQAIATITQFYASEGVPVIGTAQEVMLPQEQFYDSRYHLIYNFAVERSKRLAPELLPYLKATK